MCVFWASSRPKLWFSLSPVKSSRRETLQDGTGFPPRAELALDEWNTADILSKQQPQFSRGPGGKLWAPPMQEVPIRRDPIGMTIDKGGCHAKSRKSNW